MTATYKVYRYVFPDGKVYVGMTKHNLRQRFVTRYKHNSRLEKALSEVGWDGLEKEILIDGLTAEEADRLEQFYIAKFRATNPEYGYNVSPGGKATYKGLKHTEEYKRHMSEMCKGKVFSPETLQRMRESHAKERIAVTQCSLTGEFIQDYATLGLAAEAVGGYKSNITRACQSGRPYKNSFWKYTEGGDAR